MTKRRSSCARGFCARSSLFLFPHETILKQIGASLNVRDAGGSEQQQLGVAEEMKAVKDKGHVLVKAGKHAQAITLCRHAILMPHNRQDEEWLNGDTKLQSAPCRLNMALCLLRPNTPANTTQAVICCHAAALSTSGSCLLLRKGALSQGASSRAVR